VGQALSPANSLKIQPILATTPYCNLQLTPLANLFFPCFQSFAGIDGLELDFRMLLSKSKKSCSLGEMQPVPERRPMPISRGQLKFGVHVVQRSQPADWFFGLRFLWHNASSSSIRRSDCGSKTGALHTVSAFAVAVR
jgi:hypothetical protein